VCTSKGYWAAESLQAETFRTSDLALILSDVEDRSWCLHYTPVPLAWITAASDCKPASARAILCNAGQANSNGAQGWLDVLESAMLLGQCSRFLQNLSTSLTGVIGKRIPMDILRSGIPSWLQLSRKQGLTQLHKQSSRFVNKINCLGNKLGCVARCGLVEFVKALA